MAIVAKSQIARVNTYPSFLKALPKESAPSSVMKNHLDQFLHLAKLRKFKKGELIYAQNSKINGIYLVKNGMIKLGIRNSSGKELTKAIVFDGEIFGEQSIFNKKLNKEYAVARDESEVYLFSGEIVQKLLQQHSGLLMHFVDVIGQRALSMEDRLKSLVFNDSKTRMIDYLLNLAAQRGRRVGFEIVINQAITHQEIASLTATSRQTVTTILNELRNENILTFNRRRILIRDMNRLAAEKSIR